MRSLEINKTRNIKIRTNISGVVEAEFIVSDTVNLSKKEDAKVLQRSPKKEAAIMDALKHFQMI